MVWSKKKNLIEGFIMNWFHTHWGTSSAQYALDCRTKPLKIEPRAAVKYFFVLTPPPPHRQKARSAPD